MALREFQIDFNTPIHRTEGTSVTRRPDAISFDYLRAFTYGPVELGDSSSGLRAKRWYTRVDNDTNTVYVARENEAGDGWRAEVVLFNFVGLPILESDVAFEQNGRATFACERATGSGGASQIWLYWFDPTSGVGGEFVFEVIDDGWTPRVALDSWWDIANNDIQLVYLKAGSGLLRREQRDRYQTAYATLVTEASGLYVEEIGLTASNRLAVILSRRTTLTGSYALERQESHLYPFLVQDAMQLSAAIQAGHFAAVILENSLFDKEKVQLAAQLQAGVFALVVLEHDLFDVEKVELSAVLQSGVFALVIIEHTLFDKEKLELAAQLQSGVFALVIIEHTLFDKEKVQLSAQLQSGVFETV